MENLPQTIGTQEVEARVIELRGQKVILDRDVAELYFTETREINKAVRNNPEKFPDGYCFVLQPSEKQYVVENFHRMENLKKSTVEPRAFTERGLYMLATILRSPKATQTTLAIIDSFARLREISRNISDLQRTDDPEARQRLGRRAGRLLSEILIEGTETTQTETMLEVNLLALKLKHTITRKKK